MEKRNEQLEVLEDIHEMLSEALKIAANEPSVGLYYVQHHVQKAATNAIKLKDQLLETTAEVELAAEDAKDSLTCVKTMKECGPPVIDRMIKALRTASNTIPNPRQSRGSVSQLLPRPVRPYGLGRSALTRSSSYVVNWQNDSASSKRREDFQLEESPGSQKRDSKNVVTTVSSDTNKNENYENQRPAMDQPDNHIAEGYDSSDFQKTKAALTQQSTTDIDSNNDPVNYVRNLLDSAISAAGSVSESQFLGENLQELKSWVSEKGLPRFSGASLGQGKVEQQEESLRNGIRVEGAEQAHNNFEEFRAEHVAKLEAWLNDD